jgi:cobalt/nickel transport system permease protein
VTGAFDLPECRLSLPHRLDPRWKLAALLLASLGFTLLRTLGPALAALAAAVSIVALARLPWRWYLRRLGAASAMSLLFLIWIVLDVEDGVLIISWPGVHRLTVLSANLAALISLMLVMLGSTSIHNILKAARALCLPRVVLLVLLLTYRYTCLLMDEFARLRVALRVRGFRNRANLHSYRTIGQVAGTLLVRSSERAERVGQAMRSRGFDGEFRSLDFFRTTWRDVLAFSLLLGYAVGLLAWDWLAR